MEKPSFRFVQSNFTVSTDRLIVDWICFPKVGHTLAWLAEIKDEILGALFRIGICRDSRVTKAKHALDLLPAAISWLSLK